MRALSKAKLVEDFRLRTIQEAALRVIDKKGLAGATIQEIADEAGVAKGTIYLYFRSREELVRQTADLALTQLRRRLEATLEEKHALPDLIRDLVQAKIEFFDAHREFFRIYLALLMGDVVCRRERPEYRAHLERVAAALAGFMEKKEVRRVDPVRLAAFVAEGVNAVILRRLSEESPPPAESDVEWIVATLLGGISTSRSTSR